MSRIQQNNTLFSNISTQCLAEMSAFLPHDSDVGSSLASAILLINFVVGLPANVWVFWLICHGTTELLASEIHSLSLAVSETLFCLGVPLNLYCLHNLVHSTVRIFHWSYGLDILLIVQMCLLWLGRPIFQSCICIERYIAVVHPLIFIR